MSDEIYRRLNSLETTIAGQGVEIRQIRGDVQELVKVVVRGNGQSLTTRIAILEREVAARLGIAQEGVRGRWAAIVAVIGAAGAVVGGLLTIAARSLIAGGGP